MEKNGTMGVIRNNVPPHMYIHKYLSSPRMVLSIIILSKQNGDFDFELKKQKYEKLSNLFIGIDSFSLQSIELEIQGMRSFNQLRNIGPEQPKWTFTSR